MEKPICTALINMKKVILRDNFFAGEAKTIRFYIIKWIPIEHVI